ncbi:MAG: hypothetical protein J6D34_08940 [Atopobiaceae bacterium]|nr:hypothetical protein [Atopobiaceae bacterium]
MQRYAQRIATLAIAATVAGLGFAPSPARAATYEELQQRVEESTASYDEAVANVSQIQGEIDENEGKIAQIEAEMPAQRARAAESLRTLYKMQQSSNGLLDLVLSSDNFSEFIATVTYLDRIQSKNMVELKSLADMNAQLTEAKDTLNARRAQADQEAERARQAKDDALAAREEVRQQAIAQAAAEQSQAQAAVDQAVKDAAAGKTFTNASGQQAAVAVPSSSTPVTEPAAQEPAQQEEEQEQAPAEAAPTSDREAFVNKWAPRIDAYLSGYPLGGHGRTFAEAAWDYNVDPRWSPAISCIESTKGLYCFASHNAWGWGSSSWGDWDSAIRSHVSGLSAGYGYTISPSAAQKYCPPTWEDWYSSVLSEMNCI